MDAVSKLATICTSLFFARYFLFFGGEAVYLETGFSALGRQSFIGMSARQSFVAASHKMDNLLLVLLDVVLVCGYAVLYR